MPFMTGRELAVQLRSMRPGIKILFMSAFTSDSDVIENYGIQIVPGEPFLVKPFTAFDLSSKVRTLLDHHSPFGRPKSR
jgi:two-component system cell cycle sensor histidine kinase/response regulator CckA